LLHGGTSSAEREPFVEAARFVCGLLGPAPLGVMVLASTGSCIAANTTLEMLARQTLDADRLEGSQIHFDTTELDAAFADALGGEIAMAETDSPPVLGSGQGQWRLHFLPFVVDGERGVALLFEDMTEHRLTAEAFQAAEQRFRLLVDSAADGIVIYRAQILLYVNPEAVRLFGFETPDELVGRPIIDLVDAENRPSFDLRLGNVEAVSGPSLFETAFLRRDGTSFPVECRTSSARVDEMGAGFLFFRDITERKRLQARRENARRVDTLARLSISIGTELQGYVVDLRRWLARAKSASPATGNATAELASLADAMAARADVFSLARQPDSDRASSATLEDILARVCSSLNRPDLAGTRLGDPHLVDADTDELLVDLEPVPYAVRGDPRSIEVGLAVLAGAALRARVSETPLYIRGARLPATDGDMRTTYRLSIAGGKVKNGAAASSHASSTFPPTAWTFGSWEQGRDLEVLGAFASLQSQGCWIEVQTCVGGGICFEVELSLDPGRSVGAELDEQTDSPVARRDAVCERYHAPETEEMAPDTERSRGSGAHHVERATAPILICDDEARLVALTAGLLREFGFDVLTVRSGAEAIRTVAMNPIDVVILDVNLPGEDAHDIVAQLRSRSDVSVILSSGYTEEDIEPQLLHDSAVKAFLAKPYGVETLVDTIDQVRLKARKSATSTTRIDDGMARH
jgi:PAS domain S-box-containing protein